MRKSRRDIWIKSLCHFWLKGDPDSEGWNSRIFFRFSMLPFANARQHIEKSKAKYYFIYIKEINGFVTWIE